MDHCIIHFARENEGKKKLTFCVCVGLTRVSSRLEEVLSRSSVAASVTRRRAGRSAISPRPSQPDASGTFAARRLAPPRLGQSRCGWLQLSPLAAAGREFHWLEERSGVTALVKRAINTCACMQRRKCMPAVRMRGKIQSGNLHFAGRRGKEGRCSR